MGTYVRPAEKTACTTRSRGARSTVRVVPSGQASAVMVTSLTSGKSSYNSLQLSVRQRISRLEFLAGYTYSKSLDNGSGYGEQINLLDQGERSLSAFDLRDNFVISYDYQPPSTV